MSPRKRRPALRWVGGVVAIVNVLLATSAVSGGAAVHAQLLSTATAAVTATTPAVVLLNSSSMAPSNGNITTTQLSTTLATAAPPPTPPSWLPRVPNPYVSLAPPVIRSVGITSRAPRAERTVTFGAANDTLRFATSRCRLAGMVQLHSVVLPQIKNGFNQRYPLSLFGQAGSVVCTPFELSVTLGFDPFYRVPDDGDLVEVTFSPAVVVGGAWPWLDSNDSVATANNRAQRTQFFAAFLGTADPALTEEAQRSGMDAALSPYYIRFRIENVKPPSSVMPAALDRFMDGLSAASALGLGMIGGHPLQPIGALALPVTTTTAATAVGASHSAATFAAAPLYSALVPRLQFHRSLATCEFNRRYTTGFVQYPAQVAVGSSPIAVFIALPFINFVTWIGLMLCDACLSYWLVLAKRRLVKHTSKLEDAHRALGGGIVAVPAADGPGQPTPTAALLLALEGPPSAPVPLEEQFSFIAGPVNVAEGGIKVQGVDDARAAPSGVPSSTPSSLDAPLEKTECQAADAPPPATPPQGSGLPQRLVEFLRRMLTPTPDGFLAQLSGSRLPSPWWAAFCLWLQPAMMASIAVPWNGDDPLLQALTPLSAVFSWLIVLGFLAHRLVISFPLKYYVPAGLLPLSAWEHLAPPVTEEEQTDGDHPLTKPPVDIGPPDASAPSLGCTATSQQQSTEIGGHVGAAGPEAGPVNPQPPSGGRKAVVPKELQGVIRLQQTLRDQLGLDRGLRHSAEFNWRHFIWGDVGVGGGCWLAAFDPDAVEEKELVELKVARDAAETMAKRDEVMTQRRAEEAKAKATDEGAKPTSDAAGPQPTAGAAPAVAASVEVPAAGDDEVITEIDITSTKAYKDAIALAKAQAIVVHRKSTDTAEAAVEAAAFLRRYGDLCAPFRPHRQWFLLVDVLFSLAYGGLDSTRTDNGCILLSTLGSVLALTHGCVIAALGPYASPLDNWLSAGIAFGFCLACLFYLVSEASSGSVGGTTPSAEAMGTTVVFLIQVAMVARFTAVVWLRSQPLRRWTQENRRRYRLLHPPLPVAPYAISQAEQLTKEQCEAKIKAPSSPKGAALVTSASAAPSLPVGASYYDPATPLAFDVHGMAIKRSEALQLAGVAVRDVATATAEDHFDSGSDVDATTQSKRSSRGVPRSTTTARRSGCPTRRSDAPESTTDAADRSTLWTHGSSARGSLSGSSLSSSTVSDSSSVSSSSRSSRSRASSRSAGTSAASIAHSMKEGSGPGVLDVPLLGDVAPALRIPSTSSRRGTYGGVTPPRSSAATPSIEWTASTDQSNASTTGSGLSRGSLGATWTSGDAADAKTMRRRRQRPAGIPPRIQQYVDYSPAEPLLNVPVWKPVQPPTTLLFDGSDTKVNEDAANVIGLRLGQLQTAGGDERDTSQVGLFSRVYGRRPHRCIVQ